MNRTYKMMSILAVLTLITISAGIAASAGNPMKDLIPQTNNIKQITTTGPDTSKTTAASSSQYSAIFGMVDTYSRPVSSTWQTIEDYTFYLPANAYVNVEGGGTIIGYNLSAGAMLGIDDIVYDWSTLRAFSENGGCDGEFCNAGFQTSRAYYLTKGNHTVHLNIYAIPSTLITTYARGLSITAIADQKGSLEIR